MKKVEKARKNHEKLMLILLIFVIQYDMVIHIEKVEI